MNSSQIKIKDEYKASRFAYMFGCMFEYFISILTTGAYLAKLTTTIGISDSMTAILSAVASFAGMFQLISIFLANRTPVKRWILPITLTTQALVSTLYLIPFLNMGAWASVLFFLIIFMNHAGANIVSPAKSNWFLSLVDDKNRGNFQAHTNIISLAGSMIFTFLASLTLDSYEAKGDLRGAFILLTIVICILAVLHLSCLIFAKEKPIEPKKAESPLKSLGHLVRNKMFVRILIFNCAWGVINNITAPFLSTFQIKELGFSMTFISTVGIVLNFLQMFVVAFFGKLSTRFSYSSIIRIAYIFSAASFAFVILSTASNGHVMFTIYRFLGVFFSAATGVSATSILFEITPAEERTSALAINTILRGLISFLTTVSISPLFEYLQGINIVILNTRIYPQQIFATISMILTVLLVLYYHFFCHKLINRERNSADSESVTVTNE